MKKIIFLLSAIIVCCSCKAQYQPPVDRYGRTVNGILLATDTISAPLLYFGGGEIYGNSTQVLFNVPDINYPFTIEKVSDKDLGLLQIPGFITFPDGIGNTFSTLPTSIENYALGVASDSVGLFFYTKSEWIDITEAGGGGEVSIFGTPQAGQLAKWTDDHTIKGQLYLNIYSDAYKNLITSNRDITNIVPGSEGGAEWNTGYGDFVYDNLTTGRGNTAIGREASIYLTTGSNSIYIGMEAGAWNTTLSNRLFINSLGRSNIAGDTTKSIIYGLQAATTAGQHLYLNANTHISDSLYLDYISTSGVWPNQLLWIHNSTKAVFADTMGTPATWAVFMDLPSPYDMIEIRDGEFPWYFGPDDIRYIDPSHTPGVLSVLVSANEINRRNIAENREMIESIQLSNNTRWIYVLSLLIIVLLINQVRLEIKLRQCAK